MPLTSSCVRPFTSCTVGVLQVGTSSLVRRHSSRPSLASNAAMNDRIRVARVPFEDSGAVRNINTLDELQQFSDLLTKVEAAVERIEAPAE